MEILRLVAILLLIILVIAIGSKVVYKDNFAILTGTITGDGTETTISKDISYPKGYNNNNCVVITAMARNTTNETGAIACGSLFESSSYTTGGLPTQVILRTSNIGIKCRNVLVYNNSSTMVPEIDGTFSYKIVLMKTGD